MVIRLFVLSLCLLSAAWADSKKPKTKEAAAQEYAVVGGTIFRDNGFALPDAEVTLEWEGPASNPKAKIKKLKAVSSPRGEFAFRVPPAAAKYKVTVSAKGFRTAEKVVEVEGASERVDATFNMAPESKH